MTGERWATGGAVGAVWIAPSGVIVISLVTASTLPDTREFARVQGTRLQALAREHEQAHKQAQARLDARTLARLRERARTPARLDARTPARRGRRSGLEQQKSFFGPDVVFRRTDAVWTARVRSETKHGRCKRERRTKAARVGSSPRFLKTVSVRKG